MIKIIGIIILLVALIIEIVTIIKDSDKNNYLIVIALLWIYIILSNISKLYYAS